MKKIVKIFEGLCTIDPDPHLTVPSKIQPRRQAQARAHALRALSRLISREVAREGEPKEEQEGILDALHETATESWALAASIVELSKELKSD